MRSRCALYSVLLEHNKLHDCDDVLQPTKLLLCSVFSLPAKRLTKYFDLSGSAAEFLFIKTLVYILARKDGKQIFQ